MSKKEKLTKEQKKALKEEKKALKAENGTDDGMKTVIVRCVSAVVCTAIVCGSVAASAGKYADAMKELGEAKEAVSDEVADSEDNTATDDTANTADDNTAAEDTTDAADDANASDDTAGAADTGNTDTGSGSNSGSKATTKAAGQMTNAQIIEYFNKAANDAKSSSKSITQLLCKNSQASKPDISNNTIKNVADKLINANMGEDKTKTNVTYTSAADRKEKFPVKNQTWSSKLTMSDVKSVTKTSNGNIDTVTIKLIDDTTPNITPGNGHAGKAFSIITKDQIVDGAGSAGMAFIKEESIKLTFKDCRIIAKIDSKTGKLQNINYYQTWTLALSTKVVPLDVKVSFGLEEEFKINW